MLISTQLHSRSPKSTTSASLSFSSDLRKDIIWKCLTMRPSSLGPNFSQIVVLYRAIARSQLIWQKLPVCFRSIIRSFVPHSHFLSFILMSQSSVRPLALLILICAIAHDAENETLFPEYTRARSLERGLTTGGGERSRWMGETCAVLSWLMLW